VTTVGSTGSRSGEVGVSRGLTVRLLERFSIECRKTKAKVITLANHKGHIVCNQVNQSKREVIKCS